MNRKKLKPEVEAVFQWTFHSTQEGVPALRKSLAAISDEELKRLLAFALPTFDGAPVSRLLVLENASREGKLKSWDIIVKGPRDLEFVLVPAPGFSREAMDRMMNTRPLARG